MERFEILLARLERAIANFDVLKGAIISQRWSEWVMKRIPDLIDELPSM